MTDLDTIYRQYLAALNDRHLDRLAEFVHDSLRFNGDQVSRTDYGASIQSNLDAVPDFSWTVEHLLVDGDVVAVHLTDRGTPASPWLGIEPTGQSFTTTEMAFYRFKEDRIAEMWFVLDVTVAASQIGDPA